VTTPNGYQKIVLPDSTIIEAWAGGPCLVTQQRCPVWRVVLSDGNGWQRRGASVGGSMSEVSEMAVNTAMLEIATLGGLKQVHTS